MDDLGARDHAQKELLGRYRMATSDERRFVRDTLREHVAEHFPELQAPDLPDPDAFADLLCDWCLRVRERDYVLVFSTPQAAPLVRALHRAVIARGAWAPGLRIAIPGVAEDFYKLASDELLDAFPPQELAEMERIDAYLRIDAPENTRALADVDPAVLARAARARVADPGGADG